MPSNYSAPPTLADDIGNLTVSNFAGSAIQISSESFTDSNTVLMTAASTDDRIDAKGFISTSTANSTYAPINSPTFTGTITTPSHANVDTVLTSVASKAPIDAPTFTGQVAIPGFSDVATTLGGIATNASAITAITTGAPALLNTLDELAAALGDDANFATTITNTLAGKAALASPTFTGTPNLSEGFAVGGTAVTASAAELNILDGATLTVSEINLLDGVTATTNELNITDGITVSTADLNRVGGTSATTAELNLLSGVSALTSLPGLSSSVTELNTLDGLTADTSELNILDGATITTTELNKLDGFTGDVEDLNFAKDLKATGVTASELDVLDGGTNATSTTVTAGDRVVYNDDGTMKQVAMSDIVTFLNSSSVLTLLGAQSPGDAISGLTSSAAELNILDGATLSTTEINFVDGVTSAIQTQLNAKAALGGATFTGAVNIPAGSLQLAGTAITSTAGEINILDGVTATTTEVNKLAGLTSSTSELNLLDGVTATTTEINYLDGVTSNIQSQLDGSVNTLNPTFTGTVSIPTPFNIGGVSMTATAAELNRLDGVTASTGEINVLDGLTATTSELNAVAGLTSTVAELNILDGATLSTNELNVLDGILASTAELSLMDGETSATSTVVAAADRVVYNDDGTMKQVAMSDIVTFLNDASVLTNVGGGSNAVSAASTFGTDNVLIKSDGTGKGSQATGITIADSTNNMSGVGTINSGAITSSGVLTGTGITIGSAAILEAELEILDGATVTTTELNLLDGVTATTDEINILDGLTANKDELNLLDASGGSTTALATGDAFIIGDADASNATKKVLLSDLITLINAQTLSASTSGNAATATAATTAATLATARNIAGVSFDGSANIAIAPTNLTGVTATAAEINILDDATVTTAELNLLDGVTASTNEINILDGLTADKDELNLLDASAGSSVAVASGDAIIIGDASDSNATKKTTVANLVTFLNDASVLTNVGSSIATSLVSLSGVSSGSTHLGTFTGSTISDSQTIKQALQANETAIELRAPIANPTFTGEIGIGSVNVSETELGILEGATVTTAEVNKLDGVTASTAQLNIVSGKTLLASGDSFSDSDNNLLTAAATKDIITGGAVLSALKFSNSANNLISSTAVSGTDTAGKNLTLAAGQSTGTGAGGSIILQVATAAGSTGNSANSLATAVTITSDKAVALEGALTVAGNLTVNGTTTTVSTTNTLIADKLITLNDGGSAGSGTATGLEIEENGSATGFFKTDGTGDWTLKGAGTAANAVLTLDVNATKTITVGGALSIEADSVINQDLSTDATPQFSSVTADLTGDVTGNADTATTLATARNIGGVSFNGSANIDLPGVNATGNQDTSGNAATATVLATARNIGGVSFNGSANIDLPGVNATGNQDTSGNAATATVLATARTIAGQSFNGSANISIGPTDLTSVTSNATEINILDAGTSGSSVTLADGDSLIIGDASASNATKKVLMSDVQTYISASGGGISNVVEDTSPQLGGDLDSNGNTIQLKNGATSAGFIEFFEDSDNGTNKVTLIGPAATGDVTITLPATAGTVALTSSNITGSAATLTTARTIGGVSFDGSANINLPGVNTSGSQDTSGNAATATALATARTIGGVSFDGTGNISLVSGSIPNNAADTSGNAATATALATARTIGGVSFDGSANINLPGVNTSGSQDTSGNAATATALATARTIGGVSFDGSANINLVSGSIPDNAADTSGNAATATALATARTIGGVSFDGTGNITLVSGSIPNNAADTSGTAATATLASTVTVSDSNANSNLDLVFTDGSNALLEDNGALYYNPSTGTLRVPNLTVSGTTTTVDTVTMNAANAIVFEGETADAHETTLSIVDPTADHTYKLPDLGSTADEGFLAAFAANPGTSPLITATPTELNYVDGVTSAIQTQLDAKQSSVSGAASTITGSNLTASRAVVSNASGKVAVSAVTSTELGYLDGVTSAIQTQLDAKQATITGAATTIDDSNLTASRAVVSNASGKVAVSAVTSTELGYLDGVTSAIQTQLDNISGASGISDVVDDSSPQLGGDLDSNGNTIQLKNGATSAGFIQFFEDSDNGTNKVTLIGPAATTDVTITLPATAGTVALTSGNISGNAAGLSSTLAVGSGGTGATSLTDGGILLGSGTGPITAMGVLADGAMIVGDGTGDPVAESGATLRTSIGVDAAGTDNSTDVTLVTSSHDYLSISSQAITLGAVSLADDVTGTLPVGSGGTGATTLTNGGILLGSGTGAITAMAVLADGAMIVGDGTTDPVAESGATLRTSIGVGTGDSPEFTNLTLSGNLTVEGTTTTVDSTTVAIADAMLKLAKDQGSSADALDFGFYGQYGESGTAKYAGIFRDVSATGDPFTFFDSLQTEPGTTVNTGGTGYDLADISAGKITAADGFAGAITGDVTGNADTATALETARNIGGVSFDGTANINLPGVNTAGNQNTSGNATTATTATVATTVTITDNEDTNESNLIAFVAGAGSATGAHGLEMDGNLTYNPSTGKLTATQLDGGKLTVDNITLNGNTLSTTTSNFIIDASHDIVLNADGGDWTFKDNTTEILGISNQSAGDVVLTVSTADKNFTIKGTDGSSAITALDIDMGAAGAAAFNGVVTAAGLTIGSAVIGEAELEILDGANITTTEINILDGSANSDAFASNGSLADADRIVVNDDGTMKQVAMSHVATYIGSASGTFTASDITGQNALGASPASDDTFVIHDTDASALKKVSITELAGYMTGSTTSLAPKDGPTFTNIVTIPASTGTAGLKIGSVKVTADSDELNQLDADTGTVTFTIAENDGIIISDTSAGATKKAVMTDLEQYMTTYLSYIGGGPFIPAVSGISPGTDEIPTWDANGKMNRNANFKFNSTHGQTNGLTMTNAAVSFGSDIEAASRTNDTNKLMTISTPHYHNAEEDVAGLYAYNSDGTNKVCIGGGNSNFNAATEVKISAAANDATLTGTEQVVITSSDTVVKNVFQGYKTSVKAVSSTTTLTDADSGKTIYWTGGTLNLPANAEVGQQFVIINNTNGAATPVLNSNTISANWTSHSAMADETARTYISVEANKWIFIG